jgi:hypothetical protein
MIDHLSYGVLAARVAGLMAEAEAAKSSQPTQTNAVDPEAIPEPPESRQVRRHRLRMEAKRNRRAA